MSRDYRSKWCYHSFGRKGVKYFFLHFTAANKVQGHHLETDIVSTNWKLKTQLIEFKLEEKPFITILLYYFSFFHQ